MPDLSVKDVKKTVQAGETPDFFMFILRMSRYHEAASVSGSKARSDFFLEKLESCSVMSKFNIKKTYKPVS